MGHTKDFHTRIRGGGDDAIAAMEGMLNTRDSVMKGITDAFAGPRWIAVSERLPPFREEVLTFGSEGRVIGYLSDNGKWFSCHCDNETGEPWLCDPGTVTHWMPLPAPPAA